MKKLKVVFSLVCVCLLLSACAAKRPVLSPNDRFQEKGPVAAKSDIDDCVQQANAAGVTPHDETQIAADVGSRTGSAAAQSAANAAIYGGSAYGAGSIAASGARSAISGLFRSREPDYVHKRFVEDCLQNKGYVVIGWR